MGVCSKPDLAQETCRGHPSGLPWLPESVERARRRRVQVGPLSLLPDRLHNPIGGSLSADADSRPGTGHGASDESSTPARAARGPVEIEVGAGGGASGPAGSETIAGGHDGDWDRG